jgi:hypothetical protein
MSLSRGEVNPLGVLECRKLSFIPEHFTKISINKLVDIKLLEHWINYNLNSRYSIKKNFTLDQNVKMIEVIEVGLEDPNELLMLTLGCPYLHVNTKEI